MGVGRRKGGHQVRKNQQGMRAVTSKRKKQSDKKKHEGPRGTENQTRRSPRTLLGQR